MIVHLLSIKEKTLPVTRTKGGGGVSYLTTNEELEALEELDLRFHSFGLLPGGLHGLTVVSNRNNIHLGHLEIDIIISIFKHAGFEGESFKMYASRFKFT